MAALQAKEINGKYGKTDMNARNAVILTKNCDMVSQTQRFHTFTITHFFVDSTTLRDC